MLLMLAIGALFVLAIAVGATPAARSRGGTPAPSGQGVPSTSWDGIIESELATQAITDQAALVRFKAQMWVESAFVANTVGDPRSGVPQYGPYDYGTAVDASGEPESTAGFCSLGLMQVNRCANPQYEYGAGWGAASGGDLMDPADNIAAAAALWADAYRQAGGDLDTTTRIYNGSGAATFAYLSSVQAVERAWGAAA